MCVFDGAAFCTKFLSPTSLFFLIFVVHAVVGAAFFFPDVTGQPARSGRVFWLRPKLHFAENLKDVNIVYTHFDPKLMPEALITVRSLLCLASIF